MGATPGLGRLEIAARSSSPTVQSPPWQGGSNHRLANQVKLISYASEGRSSFGRLIGDGIVDASTSSSKHGSLRELLQNGGLADFDADTVDATPSLKLDEVELLPVIPDPGKILCVGLNYKDHAEESGREPTLRPTIFIRLADSQTAAGRSVTIPSVVTRFDYEGELAVIIGKAGSNISLDSAMSHVAGYACYNDFSARDWQKHTAQWTPGKNFDGTGAFGPMMVTADEIGDYTQLTLKTRVNGEVRQSATLSDLIFSVPELIAYLSSFTTLRPGDVIVTGTPGGVGMFRDPPAFLEGGEDVEVEISKVGLLRTRVVAAQPVAAG